MGRNCTRPKLRGGRANDKRVGTENGSKPRSKLLKARKGWLCKARDLRTNLRKKCISLVLGGGTLRRLTLEENRPTLGFKGFRSRQDLGLRIALGFGNS